MIKIGLIAPFEGLERSLGYAVLQPLKESFAMANASGRIGRYRLSLVALNDDLQTGTAAAQAEALVRDHTVIAVIGPFAAASASEAAAVLARGGLGAVAMAPLTTAEASMISLCPSYDDIASRLADRVKALGGPTHALRFLGTADAAAELALHDASSGARTLVGGPEMLRPWFIDLAGPQAEGAQAAACTVVGFESASDGDSAFPEVVLSRAAAEIVVRALEADLAAHGRPTRAGTAAALLIQRPATGLSWRQVHDMRWQAAPDGIP